MTRIGVIGAGIVGLAVARRLIELEPRARVIVLEKEDAVATHQTAHNSGVVHAGVYYEPGSLKAELCRRGAQLLREHCRERGLPYDECGKLVVAVDDAELERLRELERRATANGVPGVRWVERGELRSIEPHAAGVAGLHSPATAVTDFHAVASSFAADVVAAGGELHTGVDVRSIEQRPSSVVVADRFELDRVVICAGLQSDRVAALAGDRPDPEIVPFRGEYHRLRPEREHLVRGLLYPVPDPRYPFLGVHFTHRVGGGVDVGPNAVLALAREGYRRRDAGLRDTADILRSPGFRALARRHWRMGVRELRSSLSTRAFAAEARRYVPELRADDLLPAPAGVRAQAVDRDGSLVDDFRIHRLGRVTAVRNAPSPAATSSLAIAEHVAALVLD